jgi:hypothetical protein
MSRSLAWAKEEALSYETRSEFARGAPWAYQIAQKLNKLDEVCSHMALSPRYSYHRWDDESACQEALKYKSRSEFKRGNSGAYCYLTDQYLLNAACAHMEPLHKNWTKENIISLAKECSSRLEFKKANSWAYKRACKLGLLNEACAHMDGMNSWDYDSVIREAQKYTNNVDFRKSSAGAWKHAYEKGFLEEATEHMEPAIYGFSKVKPAVLYYIKFVTSETVLYKIGITNRNTEDRLAGMGLKAGTDAEIIKEIRFLDGTNARQAEKALHKKFKEFRYQGDPIMKNGNNELFTCDVLAML